MIGIEGDPTFIPAPPPSITTLPKYKRYTNITKHYNIMWPIRACGVLKNICSDPSK